MSQGRKSRILILVLVALGLIALMLFSSLPERPLSMLNSPLSAILTPLQKAGRSVKTSVVDFFASARKQRAMRAENEKLQEENLALRLEIRANERAAEEYQKIRDAYSLKDAFPWRDFQGAHILNDFDDRELDLYRIDCGSHDGLTTDPGETHAVLTASTAVFGKIYSVDYASAKILPLWHEGFSISAQSEADAAHPFRVRGDLKLKADRLLVADEIPVATAIQKGDLVTTSGVGGVFPPGLPIARVIELSDAKEDGYREAILEPVVDFNDTPIVFVLLGEEETDE